MSKHLEIKVSNIHPSTTVDELEALFADFGEVEEIFLNDDPDPGKRTYTAYVTMASRPEAEEAFTELKGEWIDGNQLSLSWYSGNRDDDEEDSLPEEDDDEDFEESWEDEQWEEDETW